MNTIAVFRNVWLLAFAAGAALVAGVAGAQQPRGGPDSSGYSIAPEGMLPPPQPEDPRLQEEPFGEPPDRFMGDHDLDEPREPSVPRERRFHLELDDR